MILTRRLGNCHYHSRPSSDLVYAHQSLRNRAIRHAMSPTRSSDASSLADYLDAGMKAHPISKGDGSPATSGNTTQDRQSHSLTPQAPVRSTLASINIVAACTSSLMITSALGPAFSIFLPYVGDDLNIQRDDLQWIMSAYSISSVST